MQRDSIAIFSFGQTVAAELFYMQGICLVLVASIQEQ
jgi:hypothetical protein